MKANEKFGPDFPIKVNVKILESLNPTLPSNEPLFEGTKIVLYKRNNYFDEEATGSR
jgi:hypothetical protein